MAAIFQLFNWRNTLIGEYETEEEAASEILWRYAQRARALDDLELRQYENSTPPRVIAVHDDLLSWLANLEPSVYKKARNMPRPKGGMG